MIRSALLKLDFCSVNENFSDKLRPLATGLLLPSASRPGKDSALIVTHRRTPRPPKARRDRRPDAPGNDVIQLRCRLVTVSPT